MIADGCHVEFRWRFSTGSYNHSGASLTVGRHTAYNTITRRHDGSAGGILVPLVCSIAPSFGVIVGSNRP
jgi:hypothetical protein